MNRISRIGVVSRVGAVALAFVAFQAGADDALPAPVAAALDAAGVPHDAIVAVVEEVGGRTPPRLVWQPARPVAPGSVMKLVTTYAALELLGPAYRWTTPVWLHGSVQRGVLHGDLVIKGVGDPNLSTDQVWRLLRRVRQLGVDEIRGDIVIDRSAFTLPPQDPYAFDGAGSRPYNVMPDALMLDVRSVTLTFTPDPERRVAIVSADPPLAGVKVDATVPLEAEPCGAWYAGLLTEASDPTRIRFGGHYPVTCGERVWSIAYADPASFDARLLTGLWREVGGRLRGRVRDGVAPTELPTFVSTSRSLTEVIHQIDKASSNPMSRQLLLTLGLVRGQGGSLEASRAVVQAWAGERFGVDAAALVIDNGSGLSRSARVSAGFLTRLLQRAWSGPTMPELISALPIAGVDGTLVDSPAAAGRAHLKTGTLRDVTAMAGYAIGSSGRRYTLVGIVNDPKAAAARPALEALVDWVVHDEPQAAATPP